MEKIPEIIQTLIWNCQFLFLFRVLRYYRFTSTCTMSTQLIFTDPKLAKLVDEIRAVAGQRARLLLTFVKHKAKPDL